MLVMMLVAAWTDSRLPVLESKLFVTTAPVGNVVLVAGGVAQRIGVREQEIVRVIRETVCFAIGVNDARNIAASVINIGRGIAFAVVSNFEPIGKIVNKLIGSATGVDNPDQPTAVVVKISCGGDAPRIVDLSDVMGEGGIVIAILICEVQTRGAIHELEHLDEVPGVLVVNVFDD